MKIPNQPNRPNVNPGKAPAVSGKSLSLENFQLETIRQSIEKNPLAALNALSEWRSQEGKTAQQSVRWPLDQMPLAVWIEPADDPRLPSEKLLFATLKQWEVASEGLIRFRLMDRAIESREAAHVEFNWSRETVKGRDYEVGHANRDVQGSRIRRVDITLIQEPIIDGHLTPEKRRSRLLATVLHEMGHALGLEHSENSRDVMYYRGWQLESLSANDIHRLRDLYKDAFQSA